MKKGGEEGPAADPPAARPDLGTPTEPHKLDLFLCHERDLRRFVQSVVRDHSLCDDIIQRTFVAAMAKGAEIPGESRRAWLFQVAFNEAKLLRRRERSEQKSKEEWRLRKNYSAPEPSDQAILTERVEQVRLALDKLSPTERELIRERMQGSKTFAEIAAEQNEPLGTILSRMRRALERLRDLLSPEL